MTEKHKHYELAYRAHCGVSFSPEKRAESYCADFDEATEQLKAAGISMERIARFEQLFTRWLSVKSRCMSSMITGPANFPTRRAEKANNAEHKASVECWEYHARLLAEAKKAAYYEAHPEARPIMAADSDAIERLQAKLECLKRSQEIMKQCNAIIRKSPIDFAALSALVGGDSKANELLRPDFCGRIGFPGFTLSGNNAEMHRIQGRIKELSARKEQGNKELDINGVRVVQNAEVMRLQLFFDGKPAPATIAMLKSNAFKWAPSVGAWQRQLTANAIYSFNHFVMPKLKEI